MSPHLGSTLRNGTTMAHLDHLFIWSVIYTGALTRGTHSFFKFVGE